MKVYLLCWGVTITFLIMCYVWGKTFLSFLHQKPDMSSSVLFGFIILLLSYQIPYLPVFLSVGSYKNLSWGWLITVGIITIVFAVRVFKKSEKPNYKAEKKTIISVGLVSAFVVFICAFISLHPPAYGPDINTYLSAMNEMCFEDIIWFEWEKPMINHGFCSLFGLMTVPSVVLGIRPYFSNLFTMRIILVLLTTLSTYRIGKIVFGDLKEYVSIKSLWLSALVIMLLMFWNSNYQSQFFFRRSDEAKSYCQFVLYPLAFSVFLQMLQDEENRKSLWIEQVLLGFSAVAVSVSSLTGYPFLVLLGSIAVLVVYRFKKTVQTILISLLCILPNIAYALTILFERKGIISFY